MYFFFLFLPSLFFFNDTATTEIYTLSLHDALPISRRKRKNSSSTRWNPARGGRNTAEKESAAKATSSLRGPSRMGTRTRSSSILSQPSFPWREKEGQGCVRPSPSSQTSATREIPSFPASQNGGGRNRRSRTILHRRRGRRWRSSFSPPA